MDILLPRAQNQAMPINVFVPLQSSQGTPVDALELLCKTTRLGIGGHPDDNEIMAHSGIAACYQQSTERFTSVVITDGAGGTRGGAYAHLSDSELTHLRELELKKAATLGDFLALINLNYTSDDVRTKKQEKVRSDLVQILQATRPQVVYIHNLFDDHDTHQAAAIRAIEAMRLLPATSMPGRVYGCEVTGSLDWYREKVRLDDTAHPELARKLLNIFDSQSENGRSYPYATICRRESNAIFDRDNKKGPRAITYAMDLTMLIHHPEVQLDEFARQTGRAFGELKGDAIKKLSA